MLRILAIILLMGSVAQAQNFDPPGTAGQKRTKTAAPTLSLNPITNIKNAIDAANGTSSSTSTTSTACDFNIFANLTATNVVPEINQCVQSKVEDVANLFLPDVTAALSSASTYGDQPGVACLKPGLAIVQAAVGTPGVPAQVAVPEVPATATTPAIPAVPAVAAVPASIPGPILIFQKFREFELSGGPSACKSWISSTVAGANPLTN